MSSFSRRDFVRHTASATALLAGCGGSGTGDDTGAVPTTGHPDCLALLDGGTYVGDVPFVGEGPADEVMMDAGLDGRLVTDLSKLEFGDLCVDNERFFVRTAASTLLPDEAGWEVLFTGLVGAESAMGIQELRGRSGDMGKILLECSGNGAGRSFGLMSVASWSGVALTDLLAELDVLPTATAVLVRGFDTYSDSSDHSSVGASWVLTLAQLAETGAFLATEMNGEPLPLHHGKPVRLVIPNWYGCAHIKWVQEITLVDDSAPATDHMLEFASRTHQSGLPALASDFRAASQDLAAMPIRVEQWTDADGETAYRVLGILWGGQATTDKLQIRFGPGNGWQNVEVCPGHEQNLYWTVWEHLWHPDEGGEVLIECRIKDGDVSTNRLDTGFYRRSVAIDAP